MSGGRITTGPLTSSPRQSRDWHLLALREHYVAVMFVRTVCAALEKPVTVTDPSMMAVLWFVPRNRHILFSYVATMPLTLMSIVTHCSGLMPWFVYVTPLPTTPPTVCSGIPISQLGCVITILLPGGHLT